MFDAEHPPSRDALASLLFEDENDPRSSCYRRVLTRPKIPWVKAAAALVLPVLILVFAYSAAVRTGFSAKTAALIAAAAALVYALAMLKRAAILAVQLYQRLAPDALRMKCRFEPSCSDYMILAIRKYGLLRGVRRGIGRLRRCNSENGGFDPP